MLICFQEKTHDKVGQLHNCRYSLWMQIVPQSESDALWAFCSLDLDSEFCSRLLECIVYSQPPLKIFIWPWRTFWWLVSTGDQMICPAARKHCCHRRRGAQRDRIFYIFVVVLCLFVIILRFFVVVLGLSVRWPVDPVPSMLCVSNLLRGALTNQILIRLKCLLDVFAAFLISCLISFWAQGFSQIPVRRGLCVFR